MRVALVGSESGESASSGESKCHFPCVIFCCVPRVPFATKTLPTRKKYFRIIFRLPFHDFDLFELILENYPIPIAFV